MPRSSRADRRRGRPISFSPRIVTSVSSAASGSVIGFDADRRNRFDPAWAGAAADALEQIVGPPELGRDDRARQQRVVERQHADAGDIRRVRGLQPHFFFRVGVAVVQVEPQRHRSAVRRQLDDDALLRIPPGQHIAILALGLDAGAERRRARRSQQARPWAFVPAAPAFAVVVGFCRLRVEQPASISEITIMAITTHDRPSTMDDRRSPMTLASIIDTRRHGLCRRAKRRAKLDELEELHARPRVVAETAQHRARHAERVLLFHAAHRHAQVRRFHDDGDAERVDFFANRLGDLARQPLLNLEPAAEDVDEPAESC